MTSDRGELSLREEAIMQLVSKGLASKEIARTLEPPCAEGTVKTHLKAIYRKLGVRSRAGAVAEWMLRSEGGGADETGPNGVPLKRD